jgi:hypothetical protein
MTTIKAFIKSHPVLSYYVLVFAISWGGILTGPFNAYHLCLRSKAEATSRSSQVRLLGSIVDSGYPRPETSPLCLGR